MKSRIRSVSVFVDFALDVNIGAVRDRPTQSVRIAFVCCTQERRYVILAIRVHLTRGGYNCAPRRDSQIDE